MKSENVQFNGPYERMACYVATGYSKANRKLSRQVADRCPPIFSLGQLGQLISIEVDVLNKGQETSTFQDQTTRQTPSTPCPLRLLFNALFTRIFLSDIKRKTDSTLFQAARTRITLIKTGLIMKLLYLNLN